MELTSKEKKELQYEVTELISYVERTHRYSMSRIYDMYNKVFDRQEKPQSCSSCLIRKVKELKKWLEDQQKEVKPKRIRKKKIFE